MKKRWPDEAPIVRDGCPGMYDWLELLDTPDHSAGVVEVRRIGLLFRGGYHPDGEARYPVEVRYLTPLTPMARAMLKAK